LWEGGWEKKSSGVKGWRTKSPERTPTGGEGDKKNII